MKISFKKLLAGGVLTLALVLAGCSNVNDVEKSEEKSLSTIAIGKDSDLRTINPTPFSAGDFSKITLSGTSNYGHIVKDASSNTELELTFTDNKASVALEYAIWDLTLKAYKTIDGTDKVVLMGKTTADLRNGGTTINFTLTSANVDTEGNVNLTCNITPNTGKPAIKKIKLGLYDMFTNAVVKEQELTDASITKDGSGKYTFEYNKTDIAPGTYNFKVYFYNDADTEIGFYSDLLVVAPGNITAENVNIPDIIQKTPDAPTDLCAYYVDGSEKGTDYNVKLTWTDKATNEEYYVITIKEYASNTDAPTDPYKVLSIKNDTTTKEEVFTSSPVYVSGSVLSNSTEAVIKLTTGKLFDISIKAVNAIGESADCTRTADPTAAETGYTAVAAADKISKTKITYSFAGKTLTKDTETYIGTYVEYQSWKNDTTAFTLLANPTINGWTAWKTVNGTEATEYNSWKDETFYAKFITNSTITFNIETYSQFDAGDVTISVNNGDTVSNNTPITVKVTGDDKYEYFQVYIKETQYTGNIGDAGIEITPKAGTTGPTPIRVQARIKDSDKWVSKVIAVNFQN
ncbi:MAG: hypothetical protein MR260_10865 [Spirochaetia bacterium]|nr:hypothetical protein [Spirochaetia bacterium]